MIKDQYRSNIDYHLARLLNTENVVQMCVENDNFFNTIYEDEWYEYEGEIYIPYLTAVHLFDEMEDEDILFADGEDIIVMWIPPVLKRFTYEDGFYHA